MSCIKKYTLFALWKFTFERKKNARIWMFPFFLVLTQDANIDFHYITLILLKCWIDVEPFSAVHSQNSLNKRLSKFTGGVPFLWCSMKHITFNDANNGEGSQRAIISIEPQIMYHIIDVIPLAINPLKWKEIRT